MCFLILEREEGRKGNIDVRKKHRLVASQTRPHWGSNRQPLYVPSPGMNPATFWCRGTTLQLTGPPGWGHQDRFNLICSLSLAKFPLQFFCLFSRSLPWLVSLTTTLPSLHLSLPFSASLLIPFLFFFFFPSSFQRERGREGGIEGEKHWRVRETSIGCLSWDLARNPGMCLDWELNQ